jgi:hypothetical protein
MSIPYANVIVHVSASLDAGERAALEQALAGQPGVGRAAVSAKAERLIRVDYDPFATSAKRILQTVRRRGVPAQLIGI